MSLLLENKFELFTKFPLLRNSKQEQRELEGESERAEEQLFNQI